MNLWTPPGLRLPSGAYLPPIAGGADWPLIEGQRFSTHGADAAASTGTSATVGGANTKGAYAQLVASTPFDASGILLFLLQNQSDDYLCDLAVGGAGSEVIIAENLLLSGLFSNVWPYRLPVGIPAGQRLSYRIQATTGTDTAKAVAVLLGQGFLPSQPLSRITTYGAATADSGGVSVDPGGTAHTKGAYSEIVASTTNAMKSMLIAFGDQDNHTRTTGAWLVDIAVGAATSEQIILADLLLGCNINADMVWPQLIGPIPCDIPAGTRLSARAQSENIDAADRLFDIIIYGVD